MLSKLQAFLSVKHILIRDPSFVWRSLDVLNYLSKLFSLQFKHTHTHNITEGTALQN